VNDLDVFGRLRRAIASATRPLNKPRVYTARRGLGRGLKQIGGIGLVVPDSLVASQRNSKFTSREESFLRSLDLNAKTVYDLGAFEGVFALFFARQVGPRGNVFAFEPRREAFDRILDHIRLNDVRNVTVRNVAVGGTPGELTLLSAAGLPARTSGHRGIQHELAASHDIVETLTVPVISLDDEISSGSLPEPDFVKVDVEGMEFEVLKGMRETVERHKPRLYVEMHGEDAEGRRLNASRVVELLDEYGYSLRHVETGQPVDPSAPALASTGHIYCE
jgi:FkbM family methyltransferase